MHLHGNIPKVQFKPLIYSSFPIITFSFADLGMDEDDDEPVPLPNVNAAILKKVHL